MTVELASPPAQEFSIAPELRRSALYAGFGAFLVPLVAWLIRDLRPSVGGSRELINTSIFLIAGAALNVAAHRWRLRVDGRGIWRRRLFGWTLFDWASFARGNVTATDGGGTFLFPDRRWPNRRLSIGPVAEEERDQLRAIIARHWQRPSAPSADIPKRLAIRHGFRRRARFDPEALTFEARGEATRYLWRQVKELRIHRRSREDFDFTTLELEFPDRTLKLRVSHEHMQPIPSWRGEPGEPQPGPELVEAAIRRHVPADRVVIVSSRGEPESLREWQILRDGLARKEREAKHFRWFIIGGYVVCLAALLSLDDAKSWRGMLPMHAFLLVTWLILVLVQALIERSIRRMVADLDSRRPGA